MISTNLFQPMRQRLSKPICVSRLRCLSAISAGASGRGFFMEDAGGFRFWLTSLSDGELPLAQGVEHGQLFRDWPGGEPSPEIAFALQNSGQVKGHGKRKGRRKNYEGALSSSLRNCCSNRSR